MSLLQLDLPEAAVADKRTRRALIDAILEFTNKDFEVLAAGTNYSPAEGALYLQLKDDWADGTIPTKQVTLTIQNNRGAAQALWDYLVHMVR